MKEEINKENGKDCSVTVRLDLKTQEKLEELVAVRGISKSEAVRLCINRTQILQLGNIKDLAREFYLIRECLESNVNNLDVCEEVDKLCQCMSDLIQKVEN